MTVAKLSWLGASSPKNRLGSANLAAGFASASNSE